MRLDKINIKNFRSINNCTVQSGKISALVGENNTGKSGLLKALNVFFNYEKEEYSLLEGIHQYSNKSLVKIELTFSEVPENDRYRDLINHVELTIRMTYSFTTKKRSLH
ncbi:AAA family ATPase [Paenibacillus sp. GYB004]|uniref:AAA family ATPase n=1 Tax=Paenibacillus sp. GYB004 TaxID=2994393 RepID=UPI002F9666BF